MFWKHNSGSNSQIESLLAKEDVTLQEVMEAENIINDCRGQNKALIDFLVRPEVMQELIGLITVEPSAEVGECQRYRYPNMACELLTCDVPVLNERLAADEALLERLYAFLDCEPPLNPLLASYVSKIMAALIAKKTEQNWLSFQLTCLQVVEFLKAKECFIPALLKHLGTSAIMDLTLKIMTQVEGVETRHNILNWLDGQNIVQSLVCLLNPKVDKERHYNVAQLLCDFIRIAGDTQRNSTERADFDPLLNTLESQSTVTLLLDQMLEGEKSESAIVGGIQVLLALLENSQCNNTSRDSEPETGAPESTSFDPTECIRLRLKDFHEMLLNPPKKDAIETTIGLLDPPLGNTRLQIVKLLSAIISAKNKELIGDLEQMGTFQVLLDLFFAYPWNNFLHTQVENCFIAAFKLCEDLEDTPDENNALCTHLLLKCKLIERIIDEWTKNDEMQLKPGGVRQGFMGHLISLLNRVVSLSAAQIGVAAPELSARLDAFKAQELHAANQTQRALLAGVFNPSTGEGDSEGDMPLYIGSAASAMQQQAYAQYQAHHITPYNVDYSEFNDDAFNDADDALQSLQHRPDLNFDISEGDFLQQQELFKRVCAQNISTLDDADDQIFEDREHTFQTVIEKDIHRSDTAYSSDSDDESPPGEDAMDVESWTSPKTTVFSKDPWGNGDNGSPKADLGGGWADFSAATFESGFKKMLEKTDALNEENAVEKDLKLEEMTTDDDLTAKSADLADKVVPNDVEAVPNDCAASEPSKSIESVPEKEPETPSSAVEVVKVADSTEEMGKV